MKALVSLLIVLFVSLGAVIDTNKNNNQNSNKFEGTYDGLTENMEFQFTDTDDQIQLFQEVDEDVAFDLYEEAYFGVKFAVTWEERETEEYDDEGEPTGEVTVIKVITDLEKL